MNASIVVLYMWSHIFESSAILLHWQSNRAKHLISISLTSVAVSMELWKYILEVLALDRMFDYESVILSLTHSDNFLVLKYGKLSS